jgi:hypothetical protein
MVAMAVKSSSLAAVVLIWIPEENELCFYTGGQASSFFFFEWSQAPVEQWLSAE